MKYRLLNIKELEEFEKEFIEFLVVNGIEADQWETMKKADSEKSNQIIESFSDVILEGVLRNVKYLEYRTERYISAIQCLEEKMINVAITSLDENENILDLKSYEGLEIHRLEKVYKMSREMELFELTKKGYQISDGKTYKDLLMASLAS